MNNISSTKKILFRYMFEDKLIDTELIDKKISGHNNSNPLTLFFQIYGDNFRLHNNSYLFYNKFTGIWDSYNEHNIILELSLFLDTIRTIDHMDKCSLRDKLIMYCHKFPANLMISDENPRIIPFNNGLCYDTNIAEIRAIDRDDYIRCPTNINLTNLTSFADIDCILRDIIIDKHDSEEIYLSFKKMLGYFMLGYNNLPYLFILSGYSSNGKSLIASLLKFALGRKYIDYTDSLEISTERLSIFSKRDGDLSMKEIYEKSRSIRDKCKLLVLTNTLPTLEENLGIRSKLIIFNLKKRYCKNAQLNPHCKESNDNLLRDIINHKKEQLFSYLLHCSLLYRSDTNISGIDIKPFSIYSSAIDRLSKCIVNNLANSCPISAILPLIYGNRDPPIYTDKEIGKTIDIMLSEFNIHIKEDRFYGIKLFY